MQEENFVLLSAKVTADKTIISFTTRGSETETTKKSKKRPHPDMVTEIAKLNKILNSVFDNESMSATGLSVSPTDKGEKIVVTGKITFPSGKQVGLSSEAFGKDGYYEFEDELWDIKGYLSSEVFAYLFNGKNSDTQTSMEMDDTQQSDTGESQDPPPTEEGTNEGSGEPEPGTVGDDSDPL